MEVRDVPRVGTRHACQRDLSYHHQLTVNALLDMALDVVNLSLAAELHVFVFRNRAVDRY